MKFLRSRRGLCALAVTLLILFLFRPGVGQLRDRIAGSIGSALGRKVAIDNVRIRLLPRPGFDLEGLVINDDPAFSAEPMVRCSAERMVRRNAALRAHRTSGVRCSYSCRGTRRNSEAVSASALWSSVSAIDIPESMVARPQSCTKKARSGLVRSV